MNTLHGYPSLAAPAQRGLTLVELMVSLVLSLVLAAGMIQLFIGTKQTYRFYDALSRIQENGRFALDSMSGDIRMAGYSPPTIPSPPNALATNGTDANGNDDITVRWIDNGNQSRVYSVAARTAGGAVPTCVNAGTSLRLDRNNGGAQELIEGVEAMRIRYGVCGDANGDGIIDGPTTYVPAATVTAANNWNQVCSVRIDLMMVSLEDRVVSQPQAIFFPPYTNNAWPVNDRCLRQAFSTTVAIRNRMP